MRPPFYVRQLKTDLDDWIAKGWVPASSRASILGSVGADTSLSLSGIVGVLGVILIGAAAMSFVAANWQDMGKLVRLVVLFGSMWIAFGLGIFLMPSRPALAQAFVLLGVLLFGSNIMLVAQTYHINAHFPDGTLLWACGALVTAALVPSRASLALALGLGGLWTWQEHFDFGQVLHLEFLLFWGLCAALAGWLNWRPGIHLAALTLIFWAVGSAEGLKVLLGWRELEIVSLFVLVPLVIWAASTATKSIDRSNYLTVEHYALVLFAVAFAMMHFFGEREDLSQSWFMFGAVTSALAIGATALGLRNGVNTTIDVAGVAFICVMTFIFVMIGREDQGFRQFIALVATLIALIWSIARGTRVGDRFTINLALLGFGVWVLYAYFAAFSKFLDQTIFLAVGGILLIGLSIALDRVRRKLTLQPTSGQS